MKHALTLATTVIAALALGAAPAAAGDYTVRACNGFDGNSSWSPEVTNKYATAYTDCQGDGLVTRMSGASDGSKAPYGAGARFVFTSPDDTKIIRIQDLINANGMNGWAAGLVDSKPSWIWGGAPWTTWNTYRETDLWMDTRQLFAQVTCGDPNGCPRRYLDGLIAMKNIVVTVRDYVGPTVNITGGTVTIPGWHNGGLDYTFAANDPTGIRQVDVKIDGEPRYGKAGECSDVLARPCTDMASGGGLPEDAFGKDGSHVVTITAFDGSGNAATASQSVLVDHTAPSPPLDLRLAGGAGWRSGNDFALMWRNPPQAAAPIIGAHYVICPAGNAGNDTRGCAEGTAYGPDIHGVANLHVPKPGDWRATVWLEDGARNRDSRQASAVAGLRLDTAAPTLAFSGLSSADPTRVHVDASDDLSGVASAQIEAKRQGESAWRALQTSLDARGFSAVLDDDALPHGTYDLRARAVDGAGNEHTTEGDADGNAATRSLPLRVATRLTVGKPARVMATNSNGKRRYRTILRVRPQAAFGTTIPLRGRLTTPGANPLAAADIEVWERIALPTAQWRRIGVVRTSGTGAFRFKALRGPSRTLRFRYPGTRTIRARTTEIDLRVRAVTTARVNRHRVVNGDEVRFHGRVKGIQPAAAGKLVYLQVYVRGRWSTFATPRADAGSGLWAQTYRFAATRGLVRYRFRALVPREAGFPYATGASRSVRVTVRGL